MTDTRYIQLIGNDEQAMDRCVPSPALLSDAYAMSSMIPVQGEGEDASPSPKVPESSELPEQLPILPLRGLVVYPQTAVPLTVGQARSIKLVDDVMAGNRLMGLVASRNPELELPAAEDLFRIGTVGIIQRLFRAPDGTIRLIIQGLSRFELCDFTANEP